MYADDTSAFVQSKSASNLISMSNANLQNIDIWLALSKLSLNNENKLHDIPNKGHQINIGTIGSLKAQNSESKSHQIFRTNFKWNLSWKLHMQSLLKQTKLIFGAVRKIQGCLNRQSLKLLYTPLEFRANYCIACLIGFMVWLTRPPVLNGTVPYFHLILSVPTFSQMSHFLFSRYCSRTWLRIKEKNTFVKGAINPNFSRT